MLAVFSILVCAATLRTQADADLIGPILTKQLQSPQLVTFQLQQLLRTKVPVLALPSDANPWTADAERIRRQLRHEIIFHGWPREWVNSPPQFEDLGSLPAGKGYRLRKLRDEIVPGFYSTALLYEPENTLGKVPAVVDVMGHFIELGNKESFE